MADFSFDGTLEDIKDNIREYRGEIPELQDVVLSQNKKPLIKDTKAALEAHYAAQNEKPFEDGLKDEEESVQDVQDEAEEEPQARPYKPARKNRNRY